jgi:DNA-directed RNA polymerase specialized sigma24 family protein
VDGSVADKLLGTAPDREIAARLGVDETTVAVRRFRVGVEPYQTRVDWSLWDAQLGTRFDRELAAEIGCSLGAVAESIHDVAARLCSWACFP